MRTSLTPIDAKSGAFEISVGGRLIHSKLTMGHGKCQNDEELDAIFEHIQTALERRSKKGDDAAGQAPR